LLTEADDMHFCCTADVMCHLAVETSLWL